VQFRRDLLFRSIPCAARKPPVPACTIRTAHVRPPKKRPTCQRTPMSSRRQTQIGERYPHAASLGHGSLDTLQWRCEHCQAHRRTAEPCDQPDRPTRATRRMRSISTIGAPPQFSFPVRSTVASKHDPFTWFAYIQTIQIQHISWTPSIRRFRLLLHPIQCT